ncbi:MAG TPA: SpvB/TcaC N-terminal domain-containing protein [Candidatus Omnitrophota bacterium]|nr:SpvB/TcaC N-terminal domain-containing protein [Candidatus Omnitrophota bacterium]HPD85642.1 SpvB/TcaC N-terminal domain-containing protein [Candidatus Omnitrophota bacterium]HRZ04485.1 SpvB/TcaC N-terminal domain-containing protein [Candidatus Omnitrophota bacterium]
MRRRIFSVSGLFLSLFLLNFPFCHLPVLCAEEPPGLIQKESPDSHTKTVNPDRDSQQASEEVLSSSNNAVSQEGQAAESSQSGVIPASAQNAAIDFRALFASTSRVEVDSSTGSAALSVPIAVPAGRAGIQPSVNLFYSSASSSGLLGMGWILELGNIQRSTKKGAPQYNASDTFVLTQAGSMQELVYDTASGFYRTKIEGAFMKIELLSGGWVITDKKGVKYYFGQSDDSRQADPADSSHIFKWCLDRVEDLSGNYMTVTYLKDQQQLYPQRIDYTGNSATGLQPFASLRFDLEDRNDLVSSYRTRFLVGTRKRISQISSYVGEVLQGRYVLGYSYSGVTGRTLLTSVRQYGADGVTALPETTFTYQDGTKGFELDSSWDIPADARFAEQQSGGRGADLGVRIADVNADGYPDILKYHEYNGGPQTRKTFLHNKDKAWVQSGDWNFPGNLAVFQNTSGEIDREWGVRVADINGDGWVDLVRYFQRDPYWGGIQVSNEVYISNKSNGWVYDPDWMMPYRQNPPQDPWYDPLPITLERGQPVYGYHEFWGSVLADVNADGYEDFIRSKEDAGYSSHYTFLNAMPGGSKGWQRNSTWDTPVSVYADFERGSTLVDLNGDGLLDIFYRKDGTAAVYINTGAGWAGGLGSSWEDTFGYGDLVDGSTQFADINGDGLSDLIIATDTQHVTLINTGHGWIRDSGWDLTGGANFKNYGTRLLDANADGMADFIIHWNGNTPQMYINKGKAPDLLVEAHNGAGAMTSIEYEPSTHYQNDFLPFPIQTVKTTTLSDGFGHSYITHYVYANGLWNTQEREFRGFGFVRVQDDEGNYSNTYFLQDDIYKGRVERQESYDMNGNLYGKVVNSWDYQEIAPGINFVFLQQKDNFIYDGDITGKRTQEQYFYEESPQNGNLTKAVSLGEVDLDTGEDVASDSRSVETEYLGNDSNWINGLPKQVTVKNHSGEMVRQSRFYYDGHQNIDDLPVKGFLTKKTDWSGSNVNPTVSFAYDEYGNLISTSDALQHVTTTDYDSDYHMFPLAVTNALNHQAVNEYYGVNGVPLDSGDGFHGLWGQLKSTTDPNNKKGRKSYDVFGRVVATVSPLDSIEYPTSTVEYQFSDDHAMVTTHQREKSGQVGTIDSVQFYDGLGRLIQTKSESATPGEFTVGGQTEYNSRGLPVKKYFPFFSTNPINSIDPINPNNPHATITYDAMGRAIQTTNSDGTYVTAIYDDWTSTTIDENGHKQKSYADAYGRLIKKEEYFGTDGRSPHYPASSYTLYATTLYAYDSEGNLTQTQDAHGNITTITYDYLGRKVSMNDPDMGFWQYGYDAAGNLTQQTDAKNQVMEFHYDALNRLTNKNDGGNFNVDYTYDDDAVPGSKGRLTQAEYSLSDKTRFSQYDDLGRELESVKTINSTDYQVTRSYDVLSRLGSLRYPDQAEVFYAYNRAGQIQRVSKVDDSDPFTKLLMHADGVDGSAMFLDSSVSEHSITANGNAQIDTDQFKFNGASGLFDGAGDYLSISDSDDWNFGAGDFTVDAWIRFDSTANTQTIIGQWNDGGHYWFITWYQPSALLFFAARNGDSPITDDIQVLKSWSPVVNTWYHIALVRNENAFTLYVDGSSIGTETDDSPIADLTGGLSIGRRGYDGLECFNGWMDELRISKGIARWTENFIPPTEPYSQDNSQAYVSDIQYNSSGQITEIDYGNGDVTTYTYDPTTLRLNRLVTINVQQQILQDLNYTYDSAGNILTITDGVHAGANQAFQYDALNRLVQAVGTYGTKNYSYDEIGNIIEKDGLTFYYGEGGVRPHAVTSLSDGTTFSYDVNGNMSTKMKGGETWEYAYDTENRLTSVRKNAFLLGEFEYDGDGGRVKKTVHRPSGGGGKYNFQAARLQWYNPDNALHQSMSLVLETLYSFFDIPEAEAAVLSVTTIYVGSLYETSSAGGSTKYVFLGDTRIASVDNGQVLYYHGNHLGSTDVVTNAAGEQVVHYEYEPYGVVTVAQGSDVSEFKFTGKPLDDETGLYYYGARYYNPALGRFISPDTIVQLPGDPQSLNRYSYCGNNPVNRIDVDGHKWSWGNFFKAIGIAIAGAALTIFSGGALAPLIGTYWTGVVTGGLVGATVGGSFAAATGGNIGMGILTGFAGGALFAGVMPGLSMLSDNIARGMTLGGATGPLSAGASMAADFGASFMAGAMSGAAVAGIAGADVGNGALMGGAIAGGFSLLSNTAYLMRTREIQQIQSDPDSSTRNLSGKSSGIRGDRVKLAGDRYNPFDLKAGPSPLGGHQGGQGKIFGFNYPPGGIIDHIFESWAGPHDWLNGWTYDSYGNLRNLNLFEKGINTFTNPLNVAIAVPLAVPLAIEPIGYSAPSIIYGESHRNER